MDSAGNYGSGPVVHLGYNWQHSLATHYPYPPPPAIALMSSGDSYNPYSSQQMAPTPNNAALVSLPYPPTTVFGGQAPSVAVPTESLNHLRQALQKIQELPQMADPLSLMTSLIAVATAGVQVSRALYSIANVNGGSSEEIQSIGREISAFSGVLRDLHEFLDDAKGLISKRALLNADRILRNCKNVFANIQRMLESCSAGPRMNFWHSLQWSFRREKVKPMYAKLESFKLTLVILLSTLRLARCKQEIGNRSGFNYPSSFIG
jgi:Fungal N-terminal domain of STAND proteins